MTTQERMCELERHIELFKNFVLDAMEAFFRRSSEAKKDALRSALGSVDYAKCEAYAQLCEQQENFINECLKGE